MPPARHGEKVCRKRMAVCQSVLSTNNGSQTSKFCNVNFSIFHTNQKVDAQKTVRMRAEKPMDSRPCEIHSCANEKNSAQKVAVTV
nr:hypothetical protein [uncultured bacterium]